MYFVHALDTRDRLIFIAGPYEEALTAKHVADDFAGTQALPTFIDAEGSASQRYARFSDMEGVVINRALAVTSAGTFDGPHGPRTVVTYDTAALDLTV